ncbi:hypothetical protein C5F59_008155 [Streptomyces sp. QL37]|uniref:hypothetical protein n=1 Tax=Streptomyces sp. QL37 TaxID=2093747 RepID=UPI000CF26E61|nr:hypothetical protein [Streptomyces sp. QL37]PPQ56650.1 hypothetical protein C5F59_08245 [Streptomyces sp. QL37]
MDPYDSHHAPGRDRSPESSTPIYDRLLAEWREAARHDAGPGRVDASPGPPVTRGSARDRQGVFVPAARAEEWRG